MHHLFRVPSSNLGRLTIILCAIAYHLPTQAQTAPPSDDVPSTYASTAVASSPTRLHQAIVSDHPLDAFIRAIDRQFARGRGDIESAMARTRYAALIPHLSFGYSRGTRQSERIQQGLDPYAYLSDASTLRASLSFDLSRLVAAQEGQWLHTLQNLSHHRERARKHVIDLYYTRLELLQKAFAEGVESPKHTLSVRRIEDELFYLTGLRLKPALPLH